MFVMLLVLFIFLKFYVVYILHWQVTANTRGSSAEEVAERVLSQPSLSGLQVCFGIKSLFFSQIIFPQSFL